MQNHKSFHQSLMLASVSFFHQFCVAALKLLALLLITDGIIGNCNAVAELTALLASCILPPVLLPKLTGFTADHMPKRYVLISVGLAMLPIAAMAVWAMTGSVPCGKWLVIAAVLLATVLTAFFEPAFGALIPEIYGESRISGATGVFGASKCAGFLAGMSGAALIFEKYNWSAGGCGWILFGSAAVALISAFRINPVISPIQRRHELAYRYRETWCEGAKELKAAPGQTLAAGGDIFFTALEISIQPLLVMFAVYTLNLTRPLDIAVFALAPVSGMIIGCILGGIFSNHKIELGMIPLASLGLAVMLPVMIFCPGRYISLTAALPGMKEAVTVNIFFGAGLAAALVGIFGGVFVVPQRAYLYHRLQPARRGAALAVKNAWLSFCSALLLLITVLLSLGSCPIDKLPETIRPLTALLPSIPHNTLLIGFGIGVFCVTVFTLWKLPNFMLRFLSLTIGRIFYRVRVTGKENIPERGPVMFISNHTSYVDNLLISSCTSRPVRFLLNESIYSRPVLGFLARLTCFFKVPSAGKVQEMTRLFQEVQDHLRSGGAVCVFPEGYPSQNGLLGRFKRGFERMLPPDVAVPVIPVNVAYTWGSFFSAFPRKAASRFNSRFPVFAEVNFGKPMPAGAAPFEIRQQVSELGADIAIRPRLDEHTIQYQLILHARRHPFSKLISDTAGGNLNCFSLLLKSVVLSREIRKMSASSERFIGVLLPNSCAAAVSMLGCLYADKTPVPLNYSVAQSVFENSVKKADISHILTSRKFMTKIRIKPTPEMVFLEDIAPNIPKINILWTFLGILLLPAREFLNIISPLYGMDTAGVAALLFSSGSTGVPKGVELTHHNICGNITSMLAAIAITHDDTLLGNLPLFHSFGLTVCFWLPVMMRIKVVFAPNPLDSTAVCKAIRDYKATVLLSTPSFLQKYMHRGTPGDFDTIRLAIAGAEKLRADIASQFREFTGGRLEMLEGYGCTELSPVVSINLTGDIREMGCRAGKSGAIGLALENISTRILDPLTYKPVPPGVEGLLFVKGANVMKGYLKDPELTARVIRDGYYETGDIAVMDEDGYITICGRLSRFSKIAGEMVPHEMVECIISEMCGGDVRCVAVTGIPDPAKGEALLVLYTDDMKLSPDEIVGQLRERSISNLWIPKAKNFRRVEKLPLLGSGKLDLAALRDAAMSAAAEIKSESLPEQN